MYIQPYIILMRLGLDLNLESSSDYMNPERWIEIKENLTKKIAQFTRDEICEMCKEDACVMPVLSYEEVHQDRHNK